MVIIVKNKDEKPAVPAKKQRTISDVFANLMSDSDPSIQKEIVQELLSDENLEQKTELEKPIKWTILSLVQNFLESKKLTKSAGLLEQFKDIGMKYLISKNRQSRKEYIEALTNLNQIGASNDNAE